MKFDFQNIQYIGCIPVWAHPEHPTDQSPCVKWDCPGCNEPMWVSEKKRAYYQEHPKNSQVVCLKCVAETAHEQGMELEMADIAKVQ